MACWCGKTEAHRYADELGAVLAFYRELRREVGYPCGCGNRFHNTRQREVRMALANAQDIVTAAQAMERVLGACLTDLSCEELVEGAADVCLCTPLQRQLRNAIVAVHGYALNIFETFSNFMTDEEGREMRLRTLLFRYRVEGIDPPEENRSAPPYSPLSVAPSVAADEDDDDDDDVNEDEEE